MKTMECQEERTVLSICSLIAWMVGDKRHGLRSHVKKYSYIQDLCLEISSFWKRARIAVDVNKGLEALLSKQHDVDRRYSKPYEDHDSVPTRYMEGCIAIHGAWRATAPMDTATPWFTLGTLKKRAEEVVTELAGCARYTRETYGPFGKMFSEEEYDQLEIRQARAALSKVQIVERKIKSLGLMPYYDGSDGLYKHNNNLQCGQLTIRIDRNEGVAAQKAD